ncbi:MAG: hypothetical protein PVH77_06535 [Phycisphaerales bacterium]|jgi:hypothetical protein
MIHAFKIKAASVFSLPEATKLSFIFCFLSSVLLCFCTTGCKKPEEKPIWEQVKIGDLAPRQSDKPPSARLLKTINFDLHILEMPADNIDKLDDIRKTLYTRPIRYNSQHAFGANSFSVCFGQVRMWNEVYGLLLDADSKKIAKTLLMLTDNQTDDIAIAGISSPRAIFFKSIYGSREGANVGPGILALRIKTQKVPSSRGVINVTAYPVFSPPIGRSTIPELDTRVKRREFIFSSAAFGLKMSPGDFILLGPKEYNSDQTSLGGLFFSNPKGSLFPDETEGKSSVFKASVRIFLLVCTGIND